MGDKEKFKNTVGEFQSKGGLGKVGVYVFTNKINGFCYVGSSIQLANRLTTGYFVPNLKNRVIDTAIKKNRFI